MSREKGVLPISANFEPQKAGPFDARAIVSEKADLLLDSTWEANDGGIYAYNGMITAVYNDGSNNGLYILIDDDYSLEANWLLVGSGGGLVLIIDATVISNITTDASWVNGVYTGDTTGLVQWNYYTDNVYEYLYDGTTLVRAQVTGGALTSVSTDDTLDGNGTTTEPLSVMGQTLDKKLIQAPAYYSDSTVKQLKYEYLKNSALYYEQRFEYTAGKVTKEEVKDDANSTWLRIEYTYTGDEMDLLTYTVITAWTITV